MSGLAPWVQVAGVIQLAIAALNLALPRALRYRDNLPRLVPIVRQVFIVHSIYIALTLLIFGGLCVGFAAEMTSGSPLGRYLTACLALFWGLRIGFQLLYYDRRWRRRCPWLDRLLLLLLTFLASVFALAALATR